MPQCPRCKCVFRTPEGEEQDHGCPRCTPAMIDDELRKQSDEEAADDDWLDGHSGEDDGPDVGEADAERADVCRDARRAVDNGP